MPSPYIRVCEFSNGIFDKLNCDTQRNCSSRMSSISWFGPQAIHRRCNTSNRWIGLAPPLQVHYSLVDKRQEEVMPLPPCTPWPGWWLVVFAGKQRETGLSVGQNHEFIHMKPWHIGLATHPPRSWKGVDYATTWRMKSYNPLLWMVSRIFSHLILHVPTCLDKGGSPFFWTWMISPI